MELVYAQLKPPSSMLLTTDVLSAPSPYQFGMDELVLLAQQEQTTTEDQRHAQFAHKAWLTTLPKENVQSVEHDRNYKIGL